MKLDEKRIKVELEEEPREPVEILYANCPCCQAKFPWGLKQGIKENKKDESTSESC